MTALPDWLGLKVLVLGDVILDRFIHGSVSRISPEAPIPVVEVTHERLLPGGAANVAHNIRVLGGKPFLLGAVGADATGAGFRDVLASCGIEDAGLVEVPGRVTTVKSRIIAHHQQVVRVDREEKAPLPDGARQTVLDCFRAELPTSRAVVVSDYAKGFFDAALLGEVGRAAREARVPLVVDPKPSHLPYPGATVVTPNRDEAAGFAGRPFDSEEVPEVAAGILSQTDWEAVLFTLGAEGMVLAPRAGECLRIPAQVREVFDVTGAGDTVVAVLSLALAAGCDLPRAARLANLAAGVVVGKVGTAVCTPEELRAALAGGAR